MRCKKIINASNLHVGGGVQVAVSFIHELSKLSSSKEFDLIISTTVESNLSNCFVDFEVFNNVIIYDCIGFSFYNFYLRSVFKNYDVVFTVFGPNYVPLGKAKKSITGFAQAWIINPFNEAFFKQSYFDRISNFIKFQIHKFYFSKSDFLIVELDCVKRKLLEVGVKKDSDSIYVVRNCVSSIYSSFSQEKIVQKVCKTRKIKLGYLGRDYIHKNTDLLPLIKVKLANDYGLDFDFYVTFTDLEWENKSDFFKMNVVNVGALNVDECLDYYRELDAVIFPSLLECFSATPLEAMAAGKPLFASDRDFVKSVCNEHAYYFDPCSADNAARLIFNYFKNHYARQEELERLKQAREYSLSFSSARERCSTYISILNKIE